MGYSRFSLLLLIIGIGIHEKNYEKEVGIYKFMFETWTHKQERSHTLHECKVGIQQNPFNFKNKFLPSLFHSQEIWSLMVFFIFLLISAGDKLSCDESSPYIISLCAVPCRFHFKNKSVSSALSYTREQKLNR